MDYTIIPNEGVGSVRFNMSADEARAAIGLDYQSFKRSPLSASESDYFAEAATFFYYDADRKLEAIEFAPAVQPRLGGTELFGLNFKECSAYLAQLDEDVELEEDGAVAYRVGVSIYAPLAKDDEAAPVESVLVFRAGYYD